MTDAKNAEELAKSPTRAGPFAVAAWGLGVFTIGRLVAAFTSASMAAIVAQAVLADWVLGRLGVAWSDPEGDEPTTSRIARRAVTGALIGAGVAAAVLALAAATQGAIVGRGDAPGSLLLIGLVTAAFTAMRDELLLRGLPLRVLEGIPGHPPKLVACAVLSGAAAAAEPAATPGAIAVSALLGVSYGALWLRDRGAWLAWGADTALVFGVGTLARGGLFDARVARSAWGGGDAGLLGGGVAIAVLAPLALLAFASAARATAAGSRTKGPSGGSPGA